MRVLFILDPLQKLDPEWDSSLRLLRIFADRGHPTWIADVPLLWGETKDVRAKTNRIIPKPQYTYQTLRPEIRSLKSFDLIMIRKEPPFNAAYLYMTYLLERLSGSVVLSNHPAGIRNTNEKLGTFHFAKWLPQTMVSSSPEVLAQFQKKIKKDLVIKPLDRKGGSGIFLFKKESGVHGQLQKATRQGQVPVLAQEFLTNKPVQGDKRIFILDGKIIAAFEKHCRQGEFRSNLSRGSTLHRTRITAREKKMVRDMRPYLKSQGLHLVGIDVMTEKLIEVNVTCPGGLAEADALYPESSLIGEWADFLERFVRQK